MDRRTLLLVFSILLVGSVSALDFEDYPQPFIDSNGVYNDNTAVVVGANSPASDTLAAVDIAQRLQFDAKIPIINSSGGVEYIPADIDVDTRLDTEVDSPENFDLILISTECSNNIINLVDPTLCFGGNTWLTPGEALMKFVPNGNNVAVIIMGGAAIDTRKAGKVIKNYDDYALHGDTILVTGSLSNPIATTYITSNFEARLIFLEGKLSQLEQNITFLQETIQTMWNSIEGHSNQLTNILNDIIDHEERIEALEEGTPPPEPECNNDVDCEDNFECVVQQCVPEEPPQGQVVIFRTNAEEGKYHGTELTVDSDEDGEMENWRYVSRGSKRPRECIANTPEGYCVYKYSGKIYVNPEDRDFWRFSDGGSLPTTSEPTEPFASNGQEVYA